jgi:hypothetical protein
MVCLDELPKLTGVVDGGGKLKAFLADQSDRTLIGPPNESWLICSSVRRQPAAKRTGAIMPGAECGRRSL